jgi:hypothetical protein
VGGDQEMVHFSLFLFREPLTPDFNNKRRIAWITLGPADI